MPPDEGDRTRPTDESAPRHAGSDNRPGTARTEPDQHLGPAAADPDGGTAAAMARGGERFAGTPEGPQARGTKTAEAPGEDGAGPPDPPLSDAEPGGPPNLAARHAPAADGEPIRIDTTTRRVIDLLANPDTADKIALVVKPALELLGKAFNKWGEVDDPLGGIETDGLPPTLLGAATLAKARLDADYPISPISENRDSDDPISRS